MIKKTKFLLNISIINENKGEIVINAVNSVVSSFPQGHKWRNSNFAMDLMKQVAEELSSQDIVTEEEVNFLIKRYTGNIGIL